MDTPETPSSSTATPAPASAPSPASSGITSTPASAAPATSDIDFTAIGTAEGNFPRALLAGFIASLVGAALWALITVVTEYQIGFMAVGVGFLVGWAIRWGGQGGTLQKFAIAGAVLALFGCLLGNFLTIAAIVGKVQGIEFFPVVGRLLSQPGVAVEVMMDSAQLMDALFYAIAVYEGYKLSRLSVRG